MSDKWFIDTNILVYANDASEADKQRIARKLIRESMLAGSAVISVQVLNEFWVTVTRKILNPLNEEHAKKEIELLSLMEIVDLSFDLFQDAIALQSAHRLSFCDAMILAAARSEGCTRLYTEDLNAGQVIDGVEVVNPFEIS